MTSFQSTTLGKEDGCTLVTQDAEGNEVRIAIPESEEE
jgi:hypothetical protein